MARKTKRSINGMIRWIILPLSYKQIINKAFRCLTDCSCTYNTYQCIAETRNQTQNDIVARKSRSSLSHLSNNVATPHRMAIILCVCILLNAFFSCHRLKLSLLFNSIAVGCFFLLQFGFFTMWNSHCKNHVINRCVRMIESSVFFPSSSVRLLNETKSHFEHIAKEFLQTPDQSYASFYYYYFKCMSIKTHCHQLLLTLFLCIYFVILNL